MTNIKMSTITFGGEEIFNITDEKSVHFNKAQTLTEEEKKQARTNIGAASTNEVSKLSEDIADLKENGTGSGTGWTNAQIDLLDEIGNYLPFTSADGGKKWDNLITSLRGGASEEPDTPTDVTLTSISATYNGGEVDTGTALTDLTGITVTATYSDGTTKEVTDYTLSGTITEGSNTITVSYGGKTTTFTVTGVAESGGDTSDELITDGLLDYFDFRTCVYNNEGAGGSTLIQPTQGNGQLFTWANNVITSQNDNGIATNRKFIYSTDKSTNQADFGTEFTIIALTKEGVFSGDFGVIRTNVTTGWLFRGKYNTSTSSVNTDDKGDGNYDSVSDYNFQATRVKGNAMKVIFDTSSVEFDGTSYDDFVSWNSKGSIGTVDRIGTFVALAIYNRALSDVEIEEMRAFMKTLEVA